MNEQAYIIYVKEATPYKIIYLKMVFLQGGRYKKCILLMLLM